MSRWGPLLLCFLGLFPGTATAHDAAFTCLVFRECATVDACKTTENPMTVSFEQFGRYVKIEFPTADQTFYLSNATRLQDKHHLQASRASTANTHGQSALTVFNDGTFIYSVHLPAHRAQGEAAKGADSMIKTGLCQLRVS